MNNDYLSIIDEKKDFLDGISDYIWDNPELAFAEDNSANCLIEALKKEGFTVEENVTGIKTAFSGRYGSGKPVIGILGEFDALSGLGQESELAEKKSNGQSCGHGCGHNMLGTASLGAAIAVKKYLEDTKQEGTVIFYGTPGEEGGSGKAFMARDGAFDELDAAFCWHPSGDTGVRESGSLANYQVLYKFDGVASHAGGAPHLGRSALDAVELMNVGVQFLREHVIQEARIHYSITDTGGASPNVVQPHAEVLYLMRAPKNDIVKDIYERINDIAKGAALMTGTKESHVFIKACSNLVLNDAMQRMLYDKMQEVPAPTPDEEQEQKALEYAKTFSSMPDDFDGRYIRYQCRPYAGVESQGYGSTDVGDVSWVCTTAQIVTATWVYGTPGHSWQATAQGKSKLAHEMTRYAAKILAMGTVEMLNNPQLLEKAKEEHKKKVGPNGYVAPIPKEVVPKSMAAMSKK